MKALEELDELCASAEDLREYVRIIKLDWDAVNTIAPVGKSSGDQILNVISATSPMRVHMEEVLERKKADRREALKREKTLKGEALKREKTHKRKKLKEEGQKRNAAKASIAVRSKQKEVLQEEWLRFAKEARKRNLRVSIPQIARQIVSHIKVMELEFDFAPNRSKGTIENYLRDNL